MVPVATPSGLVRFSSRPDIPALPGCKGWPACRLLLEPGCCRASHSAHALQLQPAPAPTPLQVRCQALSSIERLTATLPHDAGSFSHVLRLLLGAAADGSGDVAQRLLQSTLPAVLDWVGHSELMVTQLLPQAGYLLLIGLRAPLVAKPDICWQADPVCCSSAPGRPLCACHAARSGAGRRSELAGMPLVPPLTCPAATPKPTMQTLRRLRDTLQQFAPEGGAPEALHLEAPAGYRRNGAAGVEGHVRGGEANSWDLYVFNARTDSRSLGRMQVLCRARSAACAQWQGPQCHPG